jgi:hypothetical protein
MLDWLKKLAGGSPSPAGEEVDAVPARLLRARHLCELQRQVAVRMAMTGQD